METYLIYWCLLANVITIFHKNYAHDPCFDVFCYFQVSTGPLFTEKMPSYVYKNPSYEHKTV